MFIANRNYSREDLLRRSNNLSSLYGARRITFGEGKAAGLRAVDIKTAGGLHMLLNRDRCLDLMELSYKGINLGYLTDNGINSNTILNVDANQDFASYWIGGMMTTCGLRNTGNSCELDGEIFPKHGVIGISPADQVNIEANEEFITVTGVMRECTVGKYHLELFRTIKIPSDGARVHIRDRIRNNTPRDEILFFMYHINFGFPFLDEGLELNIPKGKIIPRNPCSADFIDERLSITLPEDNMPDHCFFHLLKERDVRVDLKNKNLGIKASISYNGETLPFLVQWKSMCSGNYVLGIEPGTSMIRGRKAELEDGYNRTIKAFGEAEFETEIEISDL